MAITGVAFTMYPVTDMTRAIAFYGETLGLKQGPLATEYWAEFEIAGSTLGIGNFEQVGTPGTAQSLALEVPDMAQFRSQLSKHGIESSEPFETRVCWISVLSDPDGNRIWLHQAKPH